MGDGKARGLMARRGITVEGSADLVRRLQRMGRAAARDALVDPMKDGGETMRREIQARAPRADQHRTGPGRGSRIANSIRVDLDTRSLTEHGRVRVVVGTTVFYALWQEYGWTPPGGAPQAGQPFVRPAFDETHKEVARRALDEIWRRVERAGGPSVRGG